MVHKITSTRALRAEFWRQRPGLSRRLIIDHAGTGTMYCTDTRCAWVEFIGDQNREGRISDNLAETATLQPAQTRKVWRIQGNYGYGWDTENTEHTRADALRSIREYRENGGGQYRLRVGRETVREGV